MLNAGVLIQAGRTVTGIRVNIVPGSTAFGVELQRAPDASGAPNVGAATDATTFEPLPITGVAYLDAMPLSAGQQWYRARHIAPGYNPGTWTAWVAGSPMVISGGGSQTDIARAGVYPMVRGIPLTDALFSLRATGSDGSTAASDAHNPQGSVPPTTSDANPFSYSSWCVSVSGRGGIHWTWSGFTIYRADGSTIVVPASSSLPAAAAPTLSQVAGGALAARTRCVRIALVKDTLMFGISAESSLAISANNLLHVASPAAVAGYDGWVPLVGDVNLGNEVVQSTVSFNPPIAFGTDWTEPTAGATVPTGSISQYNDDATALAAHDWGLAASTTYFYYPCWDVINGRVAFAGGGKMTAKSNLQAARQNRDGYISLAAAGPVSALTPAVGGSTGGAGGGGCLHPETIVETPRGNRKLGELWVGASVRGRSGRWTRIMKYERRPQREWIRMRVGTGASLLMTLTHPMTLLGDVVKRAVALTLADVVHVPGAVSEIAALDRVFLEGVDQIDVECEPEREFWAGERAPTILTHNTYVQS